MDFKTFDLIAISSALSVTIPLFSFFLSLGSKRATYAVKLLGALLISSGLSDLLSRLFYNLKLNPNPVISVYIISQFALVSLIYHDSFRKKIYKRVIIGGVNVFIVFATVNMLFVQGLSGFNSNIFTASSVVFVIYAFVFFHQLLADVQEIKLEFMFIFWFNCAVIMYFGASIFIFSTISFLITTANDQALLSWTFHNIFNIIKNLILAWALYISWKHVRK
ncbi:hypothetical protein WSM22_35010 [Cytophagales bacterium WSM2-2]|nr:hypothetical protein WSM22_35010 [Cytophagales bacterium WSM2-2]